MADAPPKEIEVTPGAKPPLQAMISPMGDSGLKAYGGYLNEEFLRELAGARGRRVYKEMSENDATVGAVLEAITTLICGAEYSIKAANDTPKGEEAKKFVEGVFTDMDTPMADVLTEACTMFAYGFAPCEVTYKLRNGKTPDKKLRSKFDDGKWGIREIALRAQESIQRWELDDKTGEILGLWQQATWKRVVFVPIDKIALFRTRSVKNSPEGRSLLRNAYRAWFMKTKIEEIEAIGIERDLAGLPVAAIPFAYMDPNADPQMKSVAEMWKRVVTQVRRESREGLIIPSDVWGEGEAGAGRPKFEFKLLTTGGARTFNTTQIIDRYDRRIATTVLADFIFLGQQSVGSFALSSDKTALFAQIVAAYLKRMAAVFNQIISMLWELNDLDDEDKPTLGFGDIESPDLAELANFIGTLVSAGAQMFPDRELENFLRKAAGLPEMPEEDGLEDQGAPGDDDWILEPGAANDAPPPRKDETTTAAALKKLRETLGA